LARHWYIISNLIIQWGETGASTFTERFVTLPLSYNHFYNVVKNTNCPTTTAVSGVEVSGYNQTLTGFYTYSSVYDSRQGTYVAIGT
jgi:hypothetical protein